MKDNGQLTEANTDQIRDEKGRFISGSKGGPGRGNRKQKKISIDEIELALQQDLRSKDPKVRHPAVKLLLMLRRQENKPDADTEILDPVLQRMYEQCFSSLQADVIDGEFTSEGSSNEVDN